ncbi:hypothetical protein GCM10028803_56150 [Larkinella knui]|uniref:Carboxypeptidase regulatory-like domain-containing protein n=1 Tax=Larkinella knui TaxID=2025310 RepID=A0A3P1CN64_9BACT|nr:carboxypeptidase-like regulatory domain-containing protein [Larkinella knui]RRB14699.1 carboxypeptidase regulatory-like domain-containing protein [Larkinella knui]
MNVRLLAVALLVLTGCSKDPALLDGGEDTNWGDQPALPIVNGEVTFTLNAADDHVSVMGTTTPRMPNFPELTKKPGVVRGYVADLSGTPLEGASIGIRSTAVGGAYSGASDETDAKGYYEIAIPWGATEFYAAGYTIDYGEGRAVMSLAASDGKLGSFPSTDGLVKNFVLLSYGVFNKDLLSQKPWDQTNYAGGCLYITYNVSDPLSSFNPPTYIPENAEIEVTLTPDGPGLYGENKRFVIRKKASLSNYGFTIMNVPVGRYTLSAKVKDGPALHMEAVGRYASLHPYFGLRPTEATGSAKLLFTPDSQAGALQTLPGRGNWGLLQIKVKRPE